MSIKKPEGVPLAALYKSPDFKRNYDIEFKTALDEDMRRNAAKGAKFPTGRRKGAIEKTTEYIHKLATSRAGSSAQLFKIAKRARKIGRMTEDTFRGHVSRARNKI